jgi:hypothetical protein
MTLIRVGTCSYVKPVQGKYGNHWPILESPARHHQSNDGYLLKDQFAQIQNTLVEVIAALQSSDCLNMRNWAKAECPLFILKPGSTCRQNRLTA